MKLKILLLNLFVLLALVLNAQISQQVTTDINARKLPAAYEKPSVYTFDGYNSSTIASHSWTIYLDATACDNANQVIAMDSISAKIKRHIRDNEAPAWGINPSGGVIMRTFITKINRQWPTFTSGSNRGNLDAVEDVFRVDGYSEWVVD